MYTGHLAFGLLLKALYPSVPAFPLIFGVTWIDLLDGIFIVLGWNTVTPNLKAGPYLYFELTFIDWDHSLLTAFLLSIVWSLFFWRNSRQVSILAGISAMSHWICDWPMHNLDLALYPYSEKHFGLGLWGTLGNLSWVLEGVFVLICCIIAHSLNTKRGVNWKPIYIFLVILFISLSPWLSPTYYVAQLSRPLADYICGVLVTVGFLIPCIILDRMIESAEKKGTKTN